MKQFAVNPDPPVFGRIKGKDRVIVPGEYDVSCPREGILLFVGPGGRYTVLHNEYRKAVNKGGIYESY